MGEIGLEHPTDESYKADMGSVLHRVVNAGPGDVVKYSIEQGADVDLKDVTGRTLTVLRKAKNDEELLGILKDAGAVTT